MVQANIIIESLEDEECEGDGPSFIECEDNSELSCCLRGECCMPGLHMRSECCTLEMSEAMYEAAKA